ncbi:MAG: T9SS type A sorting domain-containing protein [bacterium]
MSHYAYVALGSSGLSILDLSDDSNPVEVNRLKGLGNLVRLELTSRELNLIVSDGRVHRLNLSDPVHPTLIRTQTLAGKIADSDMIGQDTLLLACSDEGFRAAIRTDSDDWTVAGSFTASEKTDWVRANGNNALVSFLKSYYWYDPDRNVYTYTTNLVSLDLTDLSQPQQIQRLVLDGYIQDGSFSGSRLYTVEFRSPYGYSYDELLLRILELTPADTLVPVNVQVKKMRPYGGRLAIRGQYMYIATGSMYAYRITDADSLQYVGGLGGFGCTASQAMQDTLLGVLDTFDGVFRLVSIGSPETPKLVGRFDQNVGVVDVCLVDNRVLVADLGGYVRVVDVSYPENMLEVGRIGSLGHVLDVEAKDGYIYVAAGTEGFDILTLHDDSSLELVGSIDTPGIAYALKVVDNLAYIADGPEGLRIIDISDPTHPHETGSLDTQGYAYDLDLTRQYVYLADDIYNVRIINVSDPSTPWEVGSVYVPNSAFCVRISGNRAYIGTSTGDIVILNATNPDLPTVLGNSKVFSVYSFVSKMAFGGNALFVANGSGGIAIVDVSDPEEPVILAQDETPYSYYPQYPAPAIKTGTIGLSVGDGVVYTAQGYTMRAFAFDPALITNIEPAGQPSRFALLSIYPNPFNSQFNTVVRVTDAGVIRSTLYNLLGQEILKQEYRFPVGVHTFSVDASSLASGVYLIALESGGVREVHRVVLVR